jgi:hypothetical protein
VCCAASTEQDWQHRHRVSAGDGFFEAVQREVELKAHQMVQSQANRITRLVTLVKQSEQVIGSSAIALSSCDAC